MTIYAAAVLEHFNQGGNYGWSMRASKAQGVLAKGVRGHAPPESFEILESQKGHFPDFGRGFWQF